jgi:hypothetical protein
VDLPTFGSATMPHLNPMFQSVISLVSPLDRAIQ